jgi:hypothetical protein
MGDVSEARGAGRPAEGERYGKGANKDDPDERWWVVGRGTDNK